MAAAGGLLALWMAYAEVEVFYLFLPGGRHAYEGYNWGTLLFAFIALNTAIYLAIGALGLALGWGHLRLQPSTWAAMRALLWAWLVAGLPLMALAYLALLASKDVTPAVLLGSIPFALLAYPVAPWLLYRWYGSPSVRRAFFRSLSAADVAGSPPACVGGTIALWVLYLAALQIALLLRGLFPWFGALWEGARGLQAYGVLSILLGACAAALGGRRTWAWWPALVLAAGWTASGVVTYSHLSLEDLATAMRIPAAEMAVIAGLPFAHQPMGLLTCLPPAVLTLLLLIVRRRYVAWCRRAPLGGE